MIRRRLTAWSLAVVVALVGTLAPRLVAGATWASFTMVEGSASFVDRPDAPLFVLLVGSDERGGVEVDVPFAMADPNSGAYFQAGRTRMTGAQALAFSRNRRLPDGDLNRTTLQAHLLLSALSDLRGRGTGAADTLRYLSVLLRHVRVDGLGVREMYHLGRTALAIDPARVRNYTMPAVPGWYGAASVLYAGAAAPGLFADFRDDALLQSH